jgi:hypothetical protein
LKSKLFCNKGDRVQFHVTGSLAFRIFQNHWTIELTLGITACRFSAR